MPSLYRKWRSRSFEDLIGQGHVVRTLRNAVRQGRVSHAYLFTGPRGTGKTSTARILAKALNCLTPDDGNPCNRCENCLAANEGRALDVIEIDAASNTSVENVRDLRERVGYVASEGRYKVYIIDEVHRLSGAAFDAFLKTLEEPPPHVVFVFASTEPHKVPATIMSRCQRFDFKRMSQADTAGHIAHVAAQEQIDITSDAITLLAQSAGGSMRDALGLLDQAAAYSTGTIDATSIRAALGLADPGLVARLSEHLLSGETGEGLRECGEFVDAGGDPGQLVEDLLTYWRAVLLTVTGAGKLDGVVDPALLESVQRHAGSVHEREVVAVMRALTDSSFGSKYDVPAQLPLEVGYVRAALALRNEPISDGRAGSVSVRNEPMSGRETRPAPRPPHTPSPNLRNEPISGRDIEQPVERNEPISLSGRRGPEAAGGDRSETPAATASPQTPDRGDGGGDDKSAAVAGGSGVVDDQAWERVVAGMREKSPSLQAILRSGFLMGTRDGEVTVGFLYEWHAAQFADAKKRRLLEEVVSSVLGASYRVATTVTTREEVASMKGPGAIVEDDGFIDEVANKLLEFHNRQMGNGAS